MNSTGANVSWLGTLGVQKSEESIVSEGPMGLVPRGGIVVVMGDHNSVMQKDLTNAELNQLADILGITVDRERKVSEIRSVHIYRGGRFPSGPRGGNP
jgi:K+/H+ antiporter YhaU regulatory subunit KhtT